MKILINNEQHEISDDATIQDVVVSVLQLNTAGLAIAVNDTIVSRQKWSDYRLQPDDKMLMIRASKGG